MVTTKLNLSMTEPQVRQIYAKQGDTGRVLDITLDQTPEDGTLRILRPDGVEVTSEAVTGGEVESGGTFESLTEADVTELSVGIEPIQDLNGYDKPWVGGAGKNELQVTATSQTVNGVTFTINSDGTVKANGTATAAAEFPITGSLPSADFNGKILNGCPSGGDSSTYRIFEQVQGSPWAYLASDFGNGTTLPTTTYQNIRFVIRVENGQTVNNIVFKPMVRLASVSDATYEPYSNICPITGHDEVRVTRTGKNLLNLNVRSATQNGITFTVYADGSIKVNGTATGSISLNGTTGAPPKISAGTTVTLSGVEGFTISQMYLQLVYTGADGSTISIVNTSAPTTYTFAQDATFASFWLSVRSNATINNAMVYPQLELGSTATVYEPYQGSTYTTSLGQTVYGGTLDMVTGVLTVDSRYLTVDDFPNFNNGVSGGGLHWVNVPQTYPAGVNDDTSTNVCSHAPYSSNILTGWLSRTPMYCVNLSGFPARIYVASASLADFKTEYATLQAVYKLAEPVTYQLTAQQIKTLVGTNNVWASSGDIVSVKFTYGGLLSELPSDATSVVGKCYCDVEQNGVSSMPFTLNVKKNERAT